MSKTTTATKRIAILIPAYNEAEVIGSVLSGLPNQIDGAPLDVVVINDASTDDTAEIAAKHGAIVLSHILNTGAGGATSTGLQFARNRKYTYAITMDADGQHSVEDCLRVYKELSTNKADLVIGSRLLNSTGMPAYRIVGNKGLNFITYLIFRTTATDTQSGLKGFTETALNKIKISSSGMEFCSEIIWRAKQQGITITEVPIKAIYSDYSLAKGQSNWNGFTIIKNLIKRKLLEFISA